MQQRVIRAALGSLGHRRRLLDDNPGLEEALLLRTDETADAVNHNAAIVRSTYSLEPSGRRLLDLYQRVAQSPRDMRPRPLPHAGCLLDRFLAPNRFRLIRG